MSQEAPSLMKQYRKLPISFYNNRYNVTVQRPKRVSGPTQAIKFLNIGAQQLQEAIDGIPAFPLNKEELTITVNLRSPLPLWVISTGPGDHVFWAKRHGKVNMSRFVHRNGSCPETIQLTMCLVYVQPNVWRLLCVYPGAFMPREDDIVTDPTAKRFWETHAHVATKNNHIRNTAISEVLYLASLKRIT